MKKLNRAQWLTLALGLLSLVVTAYFYPKLPDRIPTSWGFDGTVAYSGKGNIWAIGGMGALFAPLFLFLPRIDPRKRNYEKFQGSYDSFCVMMELFLLAMLALILSESFRPGRLKVSSLVVSLTGLLFLWLGNSMPKIKSNFFMGIKNPWTLSDPEVWNRTHRLAGKLFFLAGLISFILPWFLAERPLFITYFAVLMAAGLVPSVCSYLWYQQRQKEPTAEKHE